MTEAANSAKVTQSKLEGQVATLNEKVAGLESGLRVQIQAVDNLEQSLAKARGNAEKLVEEKEYLEKLILEAKDESERTLKIKELKIQGQESSLAASATVIRDLKKEKKSLQKELSEKATKIGGLRENVSQKDKRVAVLDKQIAALQASTEKSK
jgi:chromosome segregation ATPase